MGHLLFIFVRWIMREPDAAAWWELSVPRWTRVIWKTLEWLDDLPWRAGNFRRFWSVVWYFNSCDFSCSVALLAEGLKANAEHMRQHQMMMDWETVERECMIAAELAKRIGGDHPNRDYSGDRKFFSLKKKRSDYVWAQAESEYVDMLANLMRRKLRTWWC